PVRRHAEDVHADGRLHVVGRELQRVVALARTREVNPYADFSGRESGGRPARGLDLQIDRLARLAQQNHPRLETDVLHRGGEAEPTAIGVHHEKPDDHRQHDGEELQLPVARENRQHHRPGDVGGSAGRARRRMPRSHPGQNAGTPSVRAPSSTSSRRRNASGPESASIPPSTASERRPVSSETTTATASVSSVTPSAARWRVPSWRASWRLRESGRKQPAATTRSSRMKAAPSCSGEYGRKRLVSRSADTRASRATPSSAYCRRPVPRSITMSAPI